jgi:hypothetical protein
MVKWFYAVHLFLNGKKGISGLQLQRETGCTYKTCWRMLHQIRAAMGNADTAKAFGVLVEIDETYVGGRPRRENAAPGKDGTAVVPEKEPAKWGRGTGKTSVIGVRERSSGKVYAEAAPPNEKGRKLTGKQLLGVLEKAAADGTTVVSGDFSGYKVLEKNLPNGFTHLTVNHSAGQFGAGKGRPHQRDRELLEPPQAGLDRDVPPLAGEVYAAVRGRVPLPVRQPEEPGHLRQGAEAGGGPEADDAWRVKAE